MDHDIAAGGTLMAADGGPVCRWFASCTRPAPKQVEHPTLGWVNICDPHLEWLGPAPSPTQFVPPLAAAVLDRNGLKL